MTFRTPSPEFMRSISASYQNQYNAAVQKRAVSVSTEQNFLLESSESKDLDITQYIEFKTNTVDSTIAAAQIYLQGLGELNERDFPWLKQERKRVHDSLGPLIVESKTLKRSRRSLSAELSDEIKVSKRRKPVQSDMTELVTTAYAKSIREKVMAASLLKDHTVEKKTKNRKKEMQKAFKANTIDYYQHQMLNDDGTKTGLVRCHLTGLHPSDQIIAAHIVPKSLSDLTIHYIFGSEEMNTRASPKNALLLVPTIEQAMDMGQIAIVPLVPDNEGPSRWQCLVIDPAILKHTVLESAKIFEEYRRPLQFRDINGRELQFQNDNRPAKRYLYFRFIMSLMNAKQRDPNIIANLGLKSGSECFWPSPGQYLEKSTLVTLARSLSGLQLPDSLLDSTTFEGEQPVDPTEQVEIMADMQTTMDNEDSEYDAEEDSD